MGYLSLWVCPPLLLPLWLRGERKIKDKLILKISHEMRKKNQTIQTYLMKQKLITHSCGIDSNDRIISLQYALDGAVSRLQ